MPKGFRKAVAWGKGSSPKGAEAKGFPGHAGNTCMTVAYAECYLNTASAGAVILPVVYVVVLDSRCVASAIFGMEKECRK